MCKRVLVPAALLLTLLNACGGGGGSDAGAATTPTTQPPAPTLPAGWTRLADMPSGVAKFGVAALEGRIHVVGGYDTRRTTMVYDMAANTWSAGPTLPRGTDNVVAVASGTRLYAVGGEASTALQVYDPATPAWTAGPALPSPRFASAAALVNGRLHVAGGWNVSNSASASVATQSIFDPATQAWSAGAPLATARNAAAAAVLEGRLHVVGGRAPGIRTADQQGLASMEVYDSGTDSWSAGAPLPVPRASLAAVALGGRLYTFGGETAAGVSNAVERYDPATRSWTALPAMPYRTHGLGAVAVGNAIYVMGGFTGSSDAVGTESVGLYRYEPPAAAAATDVSVLMMGNSHTSSNGLPEQLNAMLQAGLAGQTVATTNAPNWGFLDERLTDGITLPLLASRRWSVVVLQAQKYSTSGLFTYSTREAEELIRRARAAGALPVLFPEWPRRGVDETQRIYDLHVSIARVEPACVAPVGQAWVLAAQRFPTLVLHESDGNHATPAGSYLAGLMLYATITGGSPLNLPEQNNGVAASVQAQLRQVAADTVQAVPPRQHCPADRRMVPAAASAAREFDATMERLWLQDRQHHGAAYVAARAAARAGNEALALRWLDRLLEHEPKQGLGDWLDPDDFARIADSPAYRQRAAAFVAAAPAVGVAHRSIETTCADLLPEGTAWDAKRSRLLLSSGRQRTAFALDADGRCRPVTPQGDRGLLAVLGMAVDAASDSLWVASAAAPFMVDAKPDESGTALLARIDLQQGRTVQTWRLPGKGLLNDLALAPDGSVYVTESQGGTIYRLRPKAAELEPVLPTGSFEGPNGIAALDADTLVVADFHGLWLLGGISGQQATLRRLQTSDSLYLGGFDGLARTGTRLVGIQNLAGLSRVWSLQVNAADARMQATLLLRGQADLRNPTTGVVADGLFHFIADPNLQTARPDGSVSPLSAGRTGHRLLSLRLPGGP